MLLTAGTLLSKCHNAVIVTDGDKYQCVVCLKHCESAGTIGDQAAGERKLAALERSVVEKAKCWTKAPLEGVHEQIAADNELRDAVTALESFEAKQNK